MLDAAWDTKQKALLGRGLDVLILDHELLQSVRDDREEELAGRVGDSYGAEFLRKMKRVGLLQEDNERCGPVFRNSLGFVHVDTNPVKRLENGRALLVDEVCQCIQSGCCTIPFASHASSELLESGGSYLEGMFRRGRSRHALQRSEVGAAFLIVVKATEIVLALLFTERRATRFSLATEEFLGILHPVLDELPFGELLRPGVLFVLHRSTKLVVVRQKVLPDTLEG